MPLTRARSGEQRQMTHLDYRPDVDGLRGIAVLLVVAFHAFPDHVSGGFVGVDIFFVISGFLITKIIASNLATDSFSFGAFYARRVKRIFPALLLVLLASYIAGWFTLFPSEFKQLGRHIAAGAGFASNIVLWSESGYFDNLADTKPLLHLWSLGIEEQFYIVWPLVLWLGWKRRINLLAIAVALALTSFTINIVTVRNDLVATFYWPHTRFWELLVGAILALRAGTAPSGGPPPPPSGALRRASSALGLALIVVATLAVTKDRDFPGWWALLPVLGAALLISSAPQSWANRVVLSNRGLVWVGLVSFPLYLWHWPLLSFARIVEGETPAAGIRVAAVLAAVMLAWLTYRLVERPIRFGPGNKRKTIVLLVSMVLIGAAGYNAYHRGGLEFRAVARAVTDSGHAGGAGVTLVRECGLGAAEKPRFADCVQDPRPPIRYALLGDSKAASLFAGLVRTSTTSGRWLFIGGNGPQGTPVPVISDDEVYRAHQPLTRLAVRSIAENPSIEKVLLVTATRSLFKLGNDTGIDDLETSGHYDRALQGLQRTIDAFAQAGKKVVILVDNPTLPHPEDCLGRVKRSEADKYFLPRATHPKCYLPLDRHLALSRKYRALLAELAQRNPGVVSLVDATDIMCDAPTATCAISKNGRLMYSFTDHVSDHAAGLIGARVNEVLNRP
jgi:peptidoglycan/LPS O-acetylase OafA/YrhL